MQHTVSHKKQEALLAKAEIKHTVSQKKQEALLAKVEIAEVAHLKSICKKQTLLTFL